MPLKRVAVCLRGFHLLGLRRPQKRRQPSAAAFMARASQGMPTTCTAPCCVGHVSRPSQYRAAQLSHSSALIAGHQPLAEPPSPEAPDVFATYPAFAALRSGHDEWPKLSFFAPAMPCSFSSTW